MNPVNPMFTHDYFKFVLQEEPVAKVQLPPQSEKKFSIKSTKKGKKSDKKEDSPWVPKKPKDEQEVD